MGPVTKIKDFCKYIYFILLLLLIFYWQQIISHITIILISIRILYNMDWDSFVLHYSLDGSLLLMEGENSRKYEFNQGCSSCGEVSSVGPKQLGNTSSNEPNTSAEVSTIDPKLLDKTSPDGANTYVRDNGCLISSKKLEDWGVNEKHNFAHSRLRYSTHCNQMANLLEYEEAINGNKYINLYEHENSTFKKKASSEFFERFVKNHNIDPDPGYGRIANTVGLRNHFRDFGNIWLDSIKGK